MLLAHLGSEMTGWIIQNKLLAPILRFGIVKYIVVHSLWGGGGREILFNALLRRSGQLISEAF